MKQGQRFQPARTIAVVILLILVLVFLSLVFGRSGSLSLHDVIDGLVSLFTNDAFTKSRFIVELRLWRALTAAGVGGCLALSGALLQGVFRNGLAAPSIIGVNAGASLGAALAILALGGILPSRLALDGIDASSALILFSSFVGAAGAVGLVVLLASRHGRISITSLLLTGIAVNACLAGVLAAIQAMALKDYDISRAIFAWTFGNLDDKSAEFAGLVWGALVIGLISVRFVAVELDLFSSGEDDARALGVPTERIKFVALGVSAFVAATAVAAAGQIAFIGLVVPHITRRIFGSSHVTLLPLCIFVGASFLLGTEFFQLLILGDSALMPGVLMSLIGGPFFLFLLLRRPREMKTW